MDGETRTELRSFFKHFPLKAHRMGKRYDKKSKRHGEARMAFFKAIDLKRYPKVAGEYMAAIEWAKTSYEMRDFIACSFETFTEDEVDEALGRYRDYKGCQWSDQWMFASPAISRQVGWGLMRKRVWLCDEFSVREAQRKAVSIYKAKVEEWAKTSGKRVEPARSLEMFFMSELFPHCGEGKPAGRDGRLRIVRRKGAGRIIDFLYEQWIRLHERSMGTQPPLVMFGWRGFEMESPYRIGWSLGLRQWAKTPFKRRDALYAEMQGFDEETVVQRIDWMRDWERCEWRLRPHFGQFGVGGYVWNSGSNVNPRVFLTDSKSIETATSFAEHLFARLIAEWGIST